MKCTVYRIVMNCVQLFGFFPPVYLIGGSFKGADVRAYVGPVVAAQPEASPEAGLFRFAGCFAEREWSGTLTHNSPFA